MTSVPRPVTALLVSALALGSGVVVSSTAVAAEGAALIPTAMTRAVDSREGLGVANTPTDGSTTTVNVAGTARIPAGADAVVANLTAVDATAPGYFVTWASGTDKPPTSNINFVAGDTVAGSTIIPLNDEGAFDLYTHGSADVLVDIAGYYKDGAYELATPKRAFDSRTTDSPVLGQGAVTTVKVAEKAGDQVVVNLTSTGSTTAGFATTYPAGTPRPATSNLNYRPGQIVSNSAVVAAGDDGYIDVYTMSPTSLVVDVLGTADDANLLAARVLDERETTEEVLAGSRSVAIDTVISGATERGALIVQVTVDDTAEDGYMTVAPMIEDGGQGTSVLNWKKGQIASNRVVVPASYAAKVNFYTNTAANVIIDVLGYTDLPAENLAHELGTKTAPRGIIDGQIAPEVIPPGSGIALPLEFGPEQDDWLVLDHTDSADADSDRTLWTPGAEATVRSPSGFSGTFPIEDGNPYTPELPEKVDTRGHLTSKIVKLDGLDEGRYQLEVPLTSNGGTASTLTYVAEFWIDAENGWGAPADIVAAIQPFEATTDGTMDGEDSQYAINGVVSEPMDFSTNSDLGVNLELASPRRKDGVHEYVVYPTDPLIAVSRMSEGGALPQNDQSVDITVTEPGSDKLAITYDPTKVLHYYPRATWEAETDDHAALPGAYLGPVNGRTSFGPVMPTEAPHVTLPSWFTATEVEYRYDIFGFVADDFRTTGLESRPAGNGTATVRDGIVHLPRVSFAAVDAARLGSNQMMITITGQGTNGEVVQFEVPLAD